MSSDAKTAANRQNARKSTGPRTGRGKSMSKFNAVKSGIYAVTPILPGEDEGAYREIEQANLEEFAPVGRVENRLVRQITTEEWKLERIDRAEIALHMRLRDAQLVKFFGVLSDSDFVYVRSEYRDEFSDQLNQHRHQKELANRDTTPGASYDDIDPAENARNLDADEKNDVDARLNRVLQLDNIILAGMVHSTESAPQTRLDHERRATARAYFAYVAKLTELQETRRTMTLMPLP